MSVSIKKNPVIAQFKIQISSQSHGIKSAAMFEYGVPTSSLAALANLVSTFHCPACKLHFRASPSDMMPLLLDCAHTVCSACTEALCTVEPTCCPVCSRVTRGGRPNRAMAEVAEDAWIGKKTGKEGDCLASDEDASMLRTPDVDGTALSDQSLPLLDHLAAASNALETGSASLASAKNDLIACVETSIARFNTVADNVVEKVNEYRARTIATVWEVCNDRVKALEAQADELTVSAGQLLACIAGIQAALARKNSSSLRHHLENAQATLKLENAVLTPRVPLRLDVKADVEPMLSALAGLARLQLYEVDGERSNVTGKGLSWFVEGSWNSEDNLVVVRCIDAGGGVADWVTASDVAVNIKSEGRDDDVGQAVNAVVVKPGLIEVMYAVHDENVKEVELRIAVGGVTLAGGPWRAVGRCKAQGIFVAVLPVKDAFGNRGLAVTSDDMHFVVSNSVSRQLSVYRVSDGSHVRSFGAAVSKSKQYKSFNFPAGLCMTTKNTILMVDHVFKCIQEITLEGAHVRFLGQGIFPAWGIAKHDDVVAVGSNGGKKRIALFSYTSGQLLSEFGTWGSGEGEYKDVSGIAFTADGKHLLIADNNCHVSLTTVEGVFVKHFGAGLLKDGPKDISLNNAGDVVVLDSSAHCVCVFSYNDGTLLRTWGTLGKNNEQFHCPAALAISRDRLYVLDSASARVQVFK